MKLTVYGADTSPKSKEIEIKGKGAKELDANGKPKWYPEPSKFFCAKAGGSTNPIVPAILKKKTPENPEKD